MAEAQEAAQAAAEATQVETEALAETQGSLTGVTRENTMTAREIKPLRQVVETDVVRQDAIDNALADLEEDAPTFGETISAAAALENTAVSTAIDLGEKQDIGDFDPTHDPFEALDDKYQPYADLFVRSINSNDTERIKNKIDREIQQRQTLADAGGVGIVATLAAGVADPINFIPVAGATGKAYRAGSKGYNILKGAYTVGKAGLISSVGAEAVFQHTQATRTAEESAINITAGTVLSGALGATAASLAKPDLAKFADGLDKDMNTSGTSMPDNEEVFGNMMKEAEAESAGAAAVTKTTREQEKILGGRATKAAAKVTAQLNPLLRAVHSPSAEHSRVMQGLVENSLYMQKNVEGIASDLSVESLIKTYNGGLVKSFEANDLNYKAHRKAQKAAGQPMLKADEFEEQVAFALRAGGDHTDPHVAATAKVYREEVFNPILKEAQETGLLPADITKDQAMRYLSRSYERNTISAKEPEFRQVIRPFIEKEASKQVDQFDKGTSRVHKSAMRDATSEMQTKGIVSKAEAAELRKLDAMTFETKLKEIADRLDDAKKADLKKITNKFDNEMTTIRIEMDAVRSPDGTLSDYVKEIEDNIIANITGHDQGLMPYDLQVTQRGVMKQRVLDFIPDSALDGSMGQSKFISNDVRSLADKYTRSMGADIELKKKFGDVTMTKAKEGINEDYAKLKAAATDEKTRTALANRQKDDLKDLDYMRDMLRGTYRSSKDPSDKWVRAFRMTRALQYMAKLGGVTISSIPDVGRHVMKHGMGRVFKDLAFPTISRSKGVQKAIRDARAAGIGEKVLQGRMATLAEITDPYARGGTAFERFVNNASQGFSKLTLMPHWNGMQKDIAAIMTQARLMDNIQTVAKGGKLSAREAKYMNWLGLGEIGKVSSTGRALDPVTAMIRKHGTTEDGVKVANLEQWEDVNARRMFAAALNKDVDTTIVTKGVADIPLWMNSEVGKTIGQFKSFAFAAHQRVFLAGMQQGDSYALQGLISMTAMGMAVSYLKSMESGRDTPDSLGGWIIEGVDRSGIMPVMMEANNIGEKLGAPGLSRMFGDGEVASRYMSRNLTGTLAGPTAGTVQDLGVVARAAFTQELARTDLKAARRLLPLQNVFYLRRGFDAFEEGMGDALDLPEKRK